MNEKQTVLLKSLIGMSHFRILSTDTLYSIINNITGKYCSVAFT